MTFIDHTVCSRILSKQYCLNLISALIFWLFVEIKITLIISAMLFEFHFQWWNYTVYWLYTELEVILYTISWYKHNIKSYAVLYVTLCNHHLLCCCLRYVDPYRDFDSVKYTVIIPYLRPRIRISQVSILIKTGLAGWLAVFMHGISNIKFKIGHLDPGAFHV